MGKRGRPKSDVTKERIVTIRMSNEDYRTLKEYSEKHQQTITETIKMGVDLLFRTHKWGIGFLLSWIKEGVAMATPRFWNGT